MSVSLKANPDGTSAAIQVGGADKLTLNTDGSLVATANPATGTRSNALATMQKFADEFGASLASSGYQKLPSGLIIQWGTTTTAGTTSSITFPITFPSSAASWVGTALDPGGAVAETVTFYSLTASGVTCVVTNSAGSSAGNITVKWIAIGY